MFGRRRGAGDRGPEAVTDLTAQASEDIAGEDEFGGAPPRASGPWDVAEPHPDLPRADLGSLRVPDMPGLQIQLVFAEQHGAWVTVQDGVSELRLQAFAAPKRDGLWDDIRAEIITEITAAGGTSAERPGQFGTELVSRLPVEPGQPQSGMQTVRFVGVDGPRWFLRGTFAGAASEDPVAAAPLESLMSQVVVVRGEHPVPPRDLLELRLPPDVAAQLAEEQARAEQENNRFTTPPNPFERGPEFTETR